MIPFWLIELCLLLISESLLVLWSVTYTFLRNYFKEKTKKRELALKGVGFWAVMLCSLEQDHLGPYFCRCLAWLRFQTWKWRWYICPKFHALSKLHGFMTQKTNLYSDHSQNLKWKKGNVGNKSNYTWYY